MPVTHYSEGGYNFFLAFADELIRVGLPIKSKVVRVCMHILYSIFMDTYIHVCVYTYNVYG